MKNFKVALLAAAVTASVVNSDVNADCLGSGIQIGVGFKASKSKFEIQNNKVKPYNERLKELVTSKLAPLQAKHEEDYGYSDNNHTLFKADGTVKESELTKVSYPIQDLEVTKYDSTNNTYDVQLKNVTQPYYAYKGKALYVKRSGYEKEVEGKIINSAGFMGDEEAQNLPRVTTYEVISPNGLCDIMMADNEDNVHDYDVKFSDETDVVDLKNKVYIGDENDDEKILDGTWALKITDAARAASTRIGSTNEQTIFGIKEDHYLEDLGANADQKSFIKNIMAGVVREEIVSNDVTGRLITGGVQERRVNVRNNYITSVINEASAKIDASNAAFAKSGIGRNYEKADHWDGAFDITLGWHQRFGDFALYFGGIAEIPCFKKEYLIKDKALASLKSNTSNSDNNNKSSSDENNEYGYTFKKTPSFAVSIMGFYNVTKMCSIGAGVNIWKQRGELNYNKTGELYLLGESVSDSKYVTMCGKTLDDFNAEAKKAGYDKKTEKVSAWMFEPTVAVNFNWGNFMMSLRGGYKIGKKFIKAGDGKFDLKGSGFNIGVNLSYTIPVI